VGRDTRKERRNLESCSKTHEEMAETDVALGNKAQGPESVNPDGCMDVDGEEGERDSAKESSRKDIYGKHRRETRRRGARGLRDSGRLAG